MRKVFAAKYPLGEFPREGLGPIADFPLTLRGAINKFNQVISSIIGVMTVVAGIWFIFQFIIGAFGYLTSGGDKTKTQEAQQKITTSIIALVIIVAAVFIIDLVGKLLGLEILRPGDLIKKMWES